MTSRITRPVKAPYTGDVHQRAWEEWDKKVPEMLAEGYPEELVNNPTSRKMFMDGFIVGLNTD